MALIGQPDPIAVARVTATIRDDAASRTLFRQSADAAYHHMEGEIGERRAWREATAWALELDRET